MRIEFPKDKVYKPLAPGDTIRQGMELFVVAPTPVVSKHAHYGLISLTTGESLYGGLSYELRELETYCKENECIIYPASEWKLKVVPIEDTDE